MDRLKLKVSPHELSELVDVLSLVSGAFSPAVIRAQRPKPDGYANGCIVSILVTRLHIRLSTLALRVRGQHPLNIPAEEGHALVIVWLNIPASALPNDYTHARNCIGRIQQALA